MSCLALLKAEMVPASRFSVAFILNFNIGCFGLTRSFSGVGNLVFRASEIFRISYRYSCAIKGLSVRHFSHAVDAGFSHNDTTTLLAVGFARQIPDTRDRIHASDRLQDAFACGPLHTPDRNIQLNKLLDVYQCGFHLFSAA